MPLIRWLANVATDVRFSLRQLRRSPGFACVAAITLALGIGANTAMFALADATLLRPLPYADPDRLVVLWERSAKLSRGVVSAPDARDWSERNRTFEAMASVFTNGRHMTAADGHVEVIPTQAVGVRFFDLLGITPLAGRTFQPSDVTPAPSVAVLGETFWRARYGGDPSMIGRVLRLDDLPVTVIGIMPARVQLFSETSVWTLAPTLPGPNLRGLRMLQVVGRIKPGMTREAAGSDMNGIAAAIAAESPDTNAGIGVTIEPLREALIGPEVRTTAVVLFGIVGFVLLMCCANVANLLLARITGRARELAVRSALGAGRRRIVAQILTESLVLASLGGLLGLGIGALILHIAPSFIPPRLLPPEVTLEFDMRVAAFCAASAFFVGLVFGLIPAWQATGTSVTHVMGADSRGATRRGGRLRSIVVAAEIAAAVLLLCGASLLLRTLLVLQGVDAGFGTGNVLTMRVNPPHITANARYPTEDALRRFYEAVEREVRALPGVKNAGWVTSLPLDGSAFMMGFDIAGSEPGSDAPANRALARYQIVSPGYFDTVDIPVVQGRGFTPNDVTGGVPVAIVDEAFAHRYFGGHNPLGARISINPISVGPVTAVMREIVGVARQVKDRADEGDEVHVYVPQSQNAWLTAALVVRPASGAALRLTSSVRGAIARVDPQLPIEDIRTLDEVAWDSAARYRFRAVLVGSFAGLALLLAVVGVFGVLAYSVQQRMREFGVRIALGAGVADVIRIVAGSAARTTLAGAAVGIVGAAFLSRSLATLLFDVSPLDPVSFGAALAVLIATAALATVVPAFRAARVDPVVTFRND
jgi:putative ABC transport system permease protein